MGRRKSKARQLSQEIREVLGRRLSSKIPVGFHPTLVPRYLPGSVGHATLKQDLLKYNEHRLKVLHAKPVVDSKPPLLNPSVYMNTQKLCSNSERLIQIKQENIMLLKKINIINRHGGKVESFNAHAYNTNDHLWRKQEQNCLDIVQRNKVFYKRLVNVESNFSKKSHDEFWKIALANIKYRSKYPMFKMGKKNPDFELSRKPTISDIESWRHTIMKQHKPVCFLTFGNNNGIQFGTVYVQLYQDEAPNICKNFIDMCKYTGSELTYKGSIVHNVVKCKYLEMGDVTLGNGKGGKTIYGKTFINEYNTLRHSRPGVLSTIPTDEDHVSSCFSITMDIMPTFDKKRTVFGKVMKGYETILLMNEICRNVGKPNPIIKITNCGVCSRVMAEKINVKFGRATAPRLKKVTSFVIDKQRDVEN